MLRILEASMNFDVLIKRTKTCKSFDMNIPISTQKKEICDKSFPHLIRDVY